MFVEISIVLLSTVIKASRCSLVIDSTSQDALYVADYCPNMKYCMEGAHVMCMYYNPHVKMGPRCSNPQNVSVTRELATKLLDVSNAIRSKIALGKEKGKDGVYLPKAYGMFRLKWDNELATFAQVLANQCVLRHDLCRATKRFPDPGQTVGLVRFTLPDWYPVSRGGTFTTPGISAPKIMYAVMQSLKSWYGQKNSVTENMLLHYPDWTLAPNNQGGRLYMEMVYASATHMGCGISAYTGYAFYDNHNDLNYNYIQVICNFSARPRQGNKVFSTKPPVGSGFTIQCGCPIGSREDIDCLCNEYERVEMKPKSIARSCPGRESCEPTMVLLPIFTVEDAPPDKLMSKAKEMEAPLASYLRERFDNSSIGHSLQSREIFDFFAETETEHNIHHGLHAMNLAPAPSTLSFKSSRQTPRDLKKHTDVMNRYYNKSPVRSPVAVSKQQYRPQPVKFAANRKSSIFARAKKFSLPARKSIGSFDIVIKKDVAPRKDFSNVQQLVNSYLKKRRFGDDGFHKGKTHEERNKAIINFEDDLTTETTLNRVEDKVMSYNHYLKAKANNTEANKILNNKSIDDNENKLMTLLDTLEREVKHIELDGTEKEIFDAKIRKIYGTVVGKPVDLLTHKQNKLLETDLHANYNLEKELIDLTHFSDDDIFKHETNRLTNDIRRHDNHITDDERKVDIHYSDKRANVLKNYDDLDTKHTRPTKNQNDEDIFKEIREFKHNIVTSDEDIKTRIYDKYSETDRGYKTSVDDLKRRNNDEVLRGKASYAHKNEDHDDQLSVERRKYYQDKLETLERRMHDARSSKHRNEHGGERVMRRMRPNRDEMQMRPSRVKSQIDAFYMPDRARYVHGY